jgi:hypothetical protein
MAFNADKYKREWAIFVDAWQDAPPANHKGGDLANKFVEATRASVYIGGHLLLVVTALLVVAVVVIL